MIIDVRGMEAPGPAVAIMENLKRINTGETLEVIGDRPFVEIIPQLEEAGYEVSIREVSGSFVLQVKKTGESKPIAMEIGECDDELDEITEDTNVAKLLKAYPQSLKILVKYGFSPLKNPAMRKTLARTISLKKAKKLLGMDGERFEEMMEELKSLKK